MYKLIIKFIWKDKKKVVRKTLEENNRGGELFLPNVKIHYKLSLIKVV